MLDCSADNLMKEITAAHRTISKRCKRSKNQITRFMGGSDELPTPENVAYQWVTLVMPMVAFQNPRVEIRSAGGQADTAKALEQGINKWCRDMKFVQKSRRSILDSFFNVGVTLITLDERPGYDGDTEFVPSSPNVHHVEPHRFVMDLCQTNDWQSRFKGHANIVDKEDLLREATQKDSDWDKEAIEGLAVDGDMDELRPYIGSELGTEIDRGEVAYWEVYVPEKQLSGKDLPSWWDGPAPSPQNGFHGTIYTVAYGKESGQGVQIREPRPFYGPPWGPYTVWGVYESPTGPLPLAPIMAAEQQIEELNAAASANSNAIADYKNLVATRDNDIAEKLKDADNGDIVSVEGMLDDENVKEVTVGGLTPELINSFQHLIERSDRQLALSEAARGATKSHVTATAESYASDARTQRYAWIKTRILESVEHALRTVAWYLHYTDSVVFPLDDDEQGSAWYLGGVHEQEQGNKGTFYDLDLRIDPYSMEKTNEAMAQAQTMRLLEVLPVIAQTAAATGDVINWPEFLESEGEHLNRKGLKQFFNMDSANMLAAAQVNPAVAGVPPKESGSPTNSAPNSPSQAGADQAIRAATGSY